VPADSQAFARMTQPLIDKTLAACRKALQDAGLKTTDIDGVVMVGGATRMPHVRKAVGAFFGQTPLTNIDRTRSSRSGRPCRRICSPAIMSRVTTGCCST